MDPHDPGIPRERHVQPAFASRDAFQQYLLSEIGADEDLLLSDVDSIGRYELFLALEDATARLLPDDFLADVDDWDALWLRFAAWEVREE